MQGDQRARLRIAETNSPSYVLSRARGIQAIGAVWKTDPEPWTELRVIQFLAYVAAQSPKSPPPPRTIAANCRSGRTLGFRYRQQSTKRALVDWDQRLTLSLGFRRAGALPD
jgi:hypothetical protein